MIAALIVGLVVAAIGIAAYVFKPTSVANITDEIEGHQD